MPKSSGVLALLGFASSAFLAGAIKVGDRAPEIRFDKLLPEQPVANASFQVLAGKAVVLEFWATWCAPCVEEIPHLNQLAQKFKDRPIVFLSVTDEEPEVVEAFLKKRSVGGLVGIAHTASPWKLYDVEGVPRTVLVDATGKVAGITFPTFLKESALEDLLAGRPLSLPNPFGSFLEPAREDAGPAPLLDLVLRPSSNPSGSTITMGPDRLLMKGVKLGPILSNLFDFPQTRLTGQPLEDAALYDLSFSVPFASRAAFPALAREAASVAFHIKVGPETRETDVWILAKTDARPAALVEPASAGGSMSRAGLGSLKLTNCAMPALVQALESAAGRPVLDETGIAGKFDFSLTYDAHDPEGAVAALRKLGFKVESARRPIEFLVVTKAE